MKNSITLNLLLFTGFLVLGYSTSARFYPSTYGNFVNMSIVTQGNALSSLQTLNSGQRSILLIGVDSIQTSKPELKSLWLMSYLPSDPTLQFLPIYPSGNVILSDREERIYRSFSLVRIFDLNHKNMKLVPGQKFIKLLEEGNYWWSGYFIFDQEGGADVMELISGQPAGQNNLDLKPTLKSGSETPGILKNDFPLQLEMLQSVCHRLGEMTEDQTITKVASQLTNHIVSSLDMEQLIMEWDLLLSSGAAPNCKFPSLLASQFTQ